MPPPKAKKELQSFLGIINYLNRFSPSNASICESLRQLICAKWNVYGMQHIISYWKKPKSIIKEGACMKFYNETQPLYLETETSGVRLEAALLQARSGTSCLRDKATKTI